MSSNSSEPTPPPVVPYGGPEGSRDDGSPEATFGTIDLSQSAPKAGRWVLRTALEIAIPLLIRAIFRALTRR